MRNRQFELPDWILKVPFADWPMHILNSLTGHAVFIDDIMALRRNHGRGLWSALDDRTQDYKKLRVLCTLRQQLDGTHREILERRIGETHRRIVRHLATSSGPAEAFREWRRSRAEVCVETGAVRMLASIASGVLKRLYKRPKSS